MNQNNYLSVYSEGYEVCSNDDTKNFKFWCEGCAEESGITAKIDSIQIGKITNYVELTLTV